MNSRETILERIRRNTATSGVAPSATEPSGLRHLQGADSEALLRLFTEQLERVAGTCHRTSSMPAAAEALRAIIEDHRAQRVARSDDPAVINLLEQVVGAFELFTPDSSREELLACEVGITTASIGIAEEGTIVLPSGHAELGRERTRLTALLPKVHVAVLRASDMVGTISEAIARVRSTGTNQRPLPPTVTFATGPSRTADIEQELVLGVHGPHSQHVILLEHE